MLTPQEKQAKWPWRLTLFRDRWLVDRTQTYFAEHHNDKCHKVTSLKGDFDSPAAAIYAIALTQEE